jgi:hypothetical protein
VQPGQLPLVLAELAAVVMDLFLTQQHPLLLLGQQFLKFPDLPLLLSQPQPALTPSHSLPLLHQPIPFELFIPPLRPEDKKIEEPHVLY